MIRAVQRYVAWLHGRWPAGTVERLPVLGDHGSCNVPGLYVVGDLTGIPLLKLAADSGTRAVRTILADPGFRQARATKPKAARDLVIVGAGVSGMAAALTAREERLDFTVYEARRPFQTIADFPRAKPIYTYPSGMRPAGELQFKATVKEQLVAELHEQTRAVAVEEGRVESVRRAGALLEVRLDDGRVVQALRVIAAIGRSGDFRELGVPGQDLPHVHNRLHDPRDFAGRKALVVGGGDSAVETAIALAEAGAEVLLCHRRSDVSRAKPDNLERLGEWTGTVAQPGRVGLCLQTTVEEIRPGDVVLRAADGTRHTRPADVVFTMLGREAPLEFFRRSGVRIAGEWTGKRIAAFAAFLVFCLALYDWKSGGILDELGRQAGAFPQSLEHAASTAPPGSLVRIALISAASPSFWYTLAYSALVVSFGARRIRRRGTPYVRAQTLTLMAIQVLPLFLLPELILPWLDAQGWLPASVADALFPRVGYGHGREFWRAYGLILAWPLNVYNVFTDVPLPAWLAIAFVQTFVLLPLAIYFWGKGVYCGWICSCGALAETLGDAQRHKMPHGPRWNRLNLAGQALLLVAFLLLGLRLASWAWPEAQWLSRWTYLTLSGSWLSYKWTVDVLLAGVVGYGCYFWFSGRVWCRFFCPLAALMHIYARFSRFRILADKKKCISCNVCTTVCHQGIDVMNFANKGLPMADPECVRCSACVSSCPTGVLSFGQVDRAGNVIAEDGLSASPVRLREG